MENQDTVEFNADAAFDEAANQLESGGLTADNEPSVANDNNQPAPDQRGENPPQESHGRSERTFPLNESRQRTLRTHG